MGRPRLIEGGVDTVDRLLLAAEGEFAQAGFEGAKLADIGRAAGISRPSLLYHFETKHALYCAVIRKVFDDLGAVLREGIAAEGSFALRLDTVLTRFAGFLKGRPSAARLVLREVLDDRGPGHQLLLEAGLPLLHMVERFIRDKGKGVVRDDVPVKDALLQLVAGAFVRSASGPLEHALWGDADTTPAIARVLFLGGHA